MILGYNEAAVWNHDAIDAVDVFLATVDIFDSSVMILLMVLPA